MPTLEADLRSQQLIDTFPGGLEAVIDVYPLDVVGERGVWQ